MKIDVNQTLKTLNGDVMKDAGPNGEAINATLKIALVNAVLAPSKKEESGVDKVKKYELSKKIFQSDEVELSLEEVTLCKEAVGSAYPSPLLVGQIIELLENRQDS